MHVLILDSDGVFRHALGTLFQSEPHITATAVADLATIHCAFDVALVDERIAGALTQDAQDALDVLSRHAPVVVIGIGEREPYEEAHVAAGAVGYWPKDGDIEELVALVRAAGLVAVAAA
jgi:DNA-binding NarL/FixJ family response regulator